MRYGCSGSISSQCHATVTQLHLMRLLMMLAACTSPLLLLLTVQRAQSLQHPIKLDVRIGMQCESIRGR